MKEEENNGDANPDAQENQQVDSGSGTTDSESE